MSSRAPNTPTGKTMGASTATMGQRPQGQTTPGQGGQMGKPSTDGQPGHMVPHEKIAMRAYEKWCQRGCPSGTEQQDWHEAETELRAEMSKTGKTGR